MKYWINTVSRDHVLAGVAGGFTQANHGSPHNLRRMERGDLLVFYSPRTKLRGGEKLQAFTALGEILDDAPFQVEMRPDFHPYRRKVSFFKAEPAAIHPLIEQLDFIEDTQHWGFPFRKGMFEIGREDFLKIADAMSVTLP